uniref:PA n=2 Tax=root TaxID=1 RepID=A0A3G1PW28_9ORTO|nr:PA [Photinus pyralis orthomyxo-like virus 2]
MDRYHKILFNSNLYDTDYINRMCIVKQEWETWTSREKEIVARHATACALLCNQEKNPTNIPEIEEQKAFGEKRGKKQIGSPRKKLAVDSENRPSTSTAVVTRSDTDTTSSSTSTASKGSDIITPELTSRDTAFDQRFRYHMINHMPLPELALNKFCEMIGARKPRTLWDIVDVKEKKLIDVIFTKDPGATIIRLQQKMAENPGHSALLMVNSETGDCILHEKADRMLGEEKLRQFLIKRRQLFVEEGIMESEISQKRDLIAQVLPSTYLNELVSKWEEDLLSEINVEHDVKWLYDEKSVGPKTIHPAELLKFLDDPTKREEGEYIRLKAKLIPEPLPVEIILTSSEDKDMVSEISLHILTELASLKRTWTINEKAPFEDPAQQLEMICSRWMKDSKKDPFNFITPGSHQATSSIEKALGIGSKKRTFSAPMEGMKQPEVNCLKPLRYHRWIEEVFRGLDQESSFKDYIPFLELLEEPIDDQHPISRISESAATNTIKEALHLNSTLYAAKLTNFYSRMGGAFKVRRYIMNKDRGQIGIFPLYATLHDSESEEERIRVGHGLCIRGPHHAKAATDRIPFISIEIVKNSHKNRTIIKYLNSGSVCETDQSLIVIRSNSIMKEDSCYNTFLINSLFNPLNTLGAMTMEHPGIHPNTRMDVFMKDLHRSNKKWFASRVTEGILFAVIGNSRDEGYFAMLRKIVMIVFNWRRNDQCASWNIREFCEKTNETLIDNPFSMYFHKYLLRIITVYNDRAIQFSSTMKEEV